MSGYYDNGEEKPLPIWLEHALGRIPGAQFSLNQRAIRDIAQHMVGKCTTGKIDAKGSSSILLPDTWQAPGRRFVRHTMPGSGSEPFPNECDDTETVVFWLDKNFYDPTVTLSAKVSNEIHSEMEWRIHSACEALSKDLKIPIYYRLFLPPPELRQGDATYTGAVVLATTPEHVLKLKTSVPDLLLKEKKNAVDEPKSEQSPHR